jgi:hypothetical protein
LFSAPYREIGPRPRDKTAALALIRSVFDEHVGRLQELLAEHEEIEADEAAERCDRAALDCSPAFERHRRYQSARNRELLRTLETFRRMRNAECGMRNGEWGRRECGWQKADGRWQKADARCEVRSGESGDGESGEPRPQAPSEEMSQECWDLVYGASWPRSQATGIAGTSGGCGEGEPERSEPTQEECLAPQKAPNEAASSQTAPLPT